jgi:serine/threonine protein kinase
MMALAIRIIMPTSIKVEHRLSNIVRLGRSEIGHGWSARVFPARLTKAAFGLNANTKVAAKVFRPQIFMDQDKHIKERIERELEWGRKNVSPRVVRNYALVEAEDQGVHTLALIMELVKGQQLDEHVRRKFPLPVEELLRITEDLIKALRVLHSSGLVHRDVKPQNVMIESSGHAKLMDLGVLKVPPPRHCGKLTASTEFLGTITYADREYLLHGRDDELSDAWSLGLTLFHMLYGHPPYVGKRRFAEIVVAIDKGSIDFPKNLSRFGTTPTSHHLFLESAMRAFLRPRRCRLTPLMYGVSTMNEKKRAKCGYYIEHLEELAASALEDMTSERPIFLPWVLYQVRKQLGLHALEQIATLQFTHPGEVQFLMLDGGGDIARATLKLFGNSLPRPSEFKKLRKTEKVKLTPQLANYLKRWSRTEKFKSQIGEIDPQLYLELLASEDSDVQVREHLRELGQTHFRRKRSSYYS